MDSTSFYENMLGYYFNDFYESVVEFYAGKARLENINGSYVTLIPKTIVP